MAAASGFWPTLKRHMHNGHLRQTGSEILAGAIALLIAGMALTGVNVSELRTLNALTERANAALRQIAEVNNMAVGIEFSARGLALTGNPIFLRYQRSNEDDLRKALTTLATLVADTPEEAPKIAKLRHLSETQIKIYSQLSEDTPDRRERIAKAIVNIDIRQVRYGLLTTLYDIREDQLRLLRTRQLSAERKVRETTILSVVIVALAFALAAAGLALIRGEKTQNTAEMGKNAA